MMKIIIVCSCDLSFPLNTLKTCDITILVCLLTFRSLVRDLWQPRHDSDQQEPARWGLLSSLLHDSADLTSCLCGVFDLTLTSCKYLSTSVRLAALQTQAMSNWQMPQSSSCDRYFIVFAQQESSLMSENQWTSTAELTVTGHLIFWPFMWHTRNYSSSTSYIEGYWSIMKWEREKLKALTYMSCFNRPLKTFKLDV